MAPRPAFAKSFPRDPRLDRLLEIFEQGNYALVRKDGRALLAATEDAELRAAVKELLRRIEPDPLAVGLVAVAGLLLVILAGYYWMTPHEAAPGRAAPAARPVSS